MPAWNSTTVVEQAQAADAEIASLRTQVADRDLVIRYRDQTIDVLKEDVVHLQTQLDALLQPALKPPMQGLVTTDPPYLPKLPYAEYGGDKFSWGICNPTQGVFDFSAIDAMLKAYPDKKFRVRIMAGVNAPLWLKTKVGIIKHVPDGGNGRPGDVPKYWNETYWTAWRDFMAALADRYEDNPQVVDIPVNYTTTIFAEPFILAADVATQGLYWSAGLTKAKHEEYLLRSVNMLMELFPTTRISLAGHSKWQYLANGKVEASWTEERRILNDLYAAYGPQLVLDDHGLGPDDIVGTPQPRETATTWYNYLAGLKDTEQSYGLQFTLNNGSMFTAAQAGLQMGACTLEYAAFEQLRTAGADKSVHDQLLANAANKK